MTHATRTIDGHTVTVTGPDAEKTANLIAAAPEMLKALNLLKASDFGANVKTAEDEKQIDRVAAFARAAIAKVEKRND